MGVVLDREKLRKLYLVEKRSVFEIASLLRCSENKINYWIRKEGITKRTISEAIYIKRNPFGDPFSFTPPRTFAERELFGLGVGLYWGEGNKANRTSIRLGNSDPALVRAFIQFLETFFRVKRQHLRFQLQIYDDVDQEEALRYWTKKLDIASDQWMATFVTHSTKPGTYRRKSAYGVVTVSYHNVKLRNLLVELVAKRGGLCINYSANRPGSSVGRATPW